MWPPVVFTPKATSRRGPVPPPSVPGPVCHSTCRGVFAEPLGAGFPKPRRNAPASTGKPVRRAGRLGECPAGIGRYRGSLAVSSCPHCWPGLLDRPQARRHSLQVGKTVTSRDCGATVATERSGGGVGGSSSRPPAGRLACPHQGPTALASFLDRCTSGRLALFGPAQHTPDRRGSHLLREPRVSHSAPADVGHSQARAVPAMSPPPPPACCCGGGAP